MAVIIKKYGNRRLYDTEQSEYVTLDQLAERIRQGVDVQVMDAKTDEDLTQQVLAQILLEGRRGADLLPVALLLKLVRLGDDALAEFFSRYMTTALDMYLQAKSGASMLRAFNPLNAMVNLADPWKPPPKASPGRSSKAAAQRPPPPMPHDEEDLEPDDDGPAPDSIADLRRELEALKASLRRKK